MNVIVYGNCQAKAVCHAMIHSEGAQEDKFHFHMNDSRPDQSSDRLRATEDADIIFVQDIASWESHGWPETISPNVQVQKFPFVYLATLWPFDCHQNPPDSLALENRRKHPEFLFHDSLLGRLRTEVLDPAERFEAYRDLNFSRPPNLNRFSEIDSIRLQRQSRLLGVDIADYVLSQFAQEPLFHTITHPRGTLIHLIASSALKQAGIHYRVPAGNLIDTLYEHQVPIHPRVVETFNIKWIDADTTYIFDAVTSLTFEEYTRRYISAFG